MNSSPRVNAQLRTVPISCELVVPWQCEQAASALGNAQSTDLQSTFCNPSSGVEGCLVHGENLTALRSLLDEGLRGGVNLVYVDPPFFAGQDFHAHPRNGNGVQQEPVYVDRWPGGLPEYLQMIEERLEVLLDLLAPTGSLLVHLDWHAVHYVKVMLDERLGPDAFRNEIVWCYTGPGSPKMRQFNRKHDTILWYSKGDTWTFEADAVRQTHHEKTHANFKNGLSGSGFGPDTRVLPPGKIPEDWWVFPVAARFPVDGRRRTGYPTEKPVALLERLLLAASRAGDVVLDAFCGSGTLAYVAAQHGRRWIGIDASPLGIHLARKRLIASATKPLLVRRGQTESIPQAWPLENGDHHRKCDAHSAGFLDANGTFVSVRHTLRLGRGTELESRPAVGDREELWELGFDEGGNAVES